MPPRTNLLRVATSLLLATQLLALAGCAAGPSSEPNAITGLSESDAAEIRQRLDAMAEEDMAVDAATKRQRLEETRRYVAKSAASAYAERVRSKVKPNIAFDTANIVGNPSAVVSVSLAPDGSVLQRTLVQSSGNSEFDAAVLRAIEASNPFPRATNGTSPPRLMLTFRPKA